MSYFPLTDKDRKDILETVGVADFQELIDVIPKIIREPKIDIPIGISELELTRELQTFANKNKGVDKITSFLGAGAYDHFIPSVVKHVLMRSEFYTAYTPYQAEASQGILQAIYEYQSIICKITGMDVSNASHYDGATSTAEAAILSSNVKRRNKILVASNINPQYLKVLKTYLSSSSLELVLIDFNSDYSVAMNDLNAKLNQDVASVIVQTPNFFGVVEDFSEIEKNVHRNGALLIVVGNLLSFAKFKSPGEWNADIACGDAQVFGNKLNFGGPYLGYIAVKKTLMRKLPGRIVGMTVDKDDKKSFVLTLQAREQHIRREKATSNICSNQALCALAALVHIVALGQKGYEKMFNINFGNINYLRNKLLAETNSEVYDGNVFNEIVVKPQHKVEDIILQCKKLNINPGLNLQKYFPKLKNRLLICATETKTKDDIDKLVQLLK